MKKVATELGRHADKTNEMVVEQRWFRPDPPLVDASWDYKQQTEHSLVLCSASNVIFSGPETYIFPCDESGEITGWSELDGSKRGVLNCYRVLEDLGYEIVKRPVNVEESEGM